MTDQPQVRVQGPPPALPMSGKVALVAGVPGRGRRCSHNHTTLLSWDGPKAALAGPGSSVRAARQSLPCVPYRRDDSTFPQLRGRSEDHLRNGISMPAEAFKSQ